MLFEIEKGTLKHRGQLIYQTNNAAFEFFPQQMGGCSIQIGYISMDFIFYFSNVKHASQIWGYHSPPEKWFKKELQIPAFCVGSLILLDESIDEGDTIRLEGTEKWVTYYDISTGWVCIGDDRQHKEDVVVEFANGIVTVINTQHLKALWLRPIVQ